MRAIDAITRFRQFHPCPWDNAVLSRWLSDLDALLFEEYLLGKPEGEDGAPPSAPAPIDPDGPLTELLLLPYPYAPDVYLSYLAARTDELSGDMERYQNDMTHFNGALQTWIDRCTRRRTRHLPGWIRAF